MTDSGGREEGWFFPTNNFKDMQLKEGIMKIISYNIFLWIRVIGGLDLWNIFYEV